jgi:uncharacterized SAM-binding protein YcdF (DUF218 family)/glycosyltransferase involved in cell wall biosynthesis
MKNRNVIIISSIDWTTIWQMHQQLAASLISSGNRVLFIENTGVRGPRLGDLGRIRDRIRNWLKSTRGFREHQPGLTLFSPLFLPFPYSRLAGWINRFVLSRTVTKWMRIVRFHDPVVFTFLPTPLAQALIRDVDPALVVYYCVDNMAGSSPAVSKVRPWEDLLFSQADLVFVTSEAIRERAAVYAKHVYLFPSGVNFEQFAAAREHAAVPDDLASLGRPIVGYVGALSSVMDQELLLKMAMHMPAVTFVLVGSRHTDVSRLAACPNIKLLGARPHDDIPSYIKGFDVALIPYVRTPFTDSVYSCKLNEYLSMGVPVVATNLREIRNFVERHGGVVEIGEDTGDFIRKVENALEGEDAVESGKRIAVARTNSWEQRFAELSAVIERHLEARMAGDSGWQERLLGYYRKNRIYLLTRLAVLAVAYAVVFHTPLVWYAGNQLVQKGQLKPADAIVVFGGHGEVAYTNASYQQRTREAVSLYKAGYAHLLIISSSVRQTMSEADVMRALILAEGVPAKAILLADRDAKNTYVNVETVKQMLDERHMKSILLVTAPYHIRRALMTWKKNAPYIEVVAVKNMDSPPSTPQWKSNVGEIRVIFYEYLAIAYNRLRGWI